MMIIIKHTPRTSFLIATCCLVRHFETRFANRPMHLVNCLSYDILMNE
jgi:membrane-bound acyltransferase YfiQ involved in biofilm formation